MKKSRSRLAVATGIWDTRLRVKGEFETIQERRNRTFHVLPVLSRTISDPVGAVPDLAIQK